MFFPLFMFLSVLYANPCKEILQVINSFTKRVVKSFQNQKEVQMVKRITPLLTAAVVLFMVVGVISCAPGSNGGSKGVTGTAVDPPYYPDDDEGLLNRTFRIDIADIRVTFDYHPDERYVDCHAVVTFFMRPGQSRPLIHLFQATRIGGGVETVTLNGENLNPGSGADMQVVRFNGSHQDALEFQRNLAEGQLHTLEITYRLDVSGNYQMFNTDCNDVSGLGNEYRFPTINTPHELAHHILTFRVHGQTPYHFTGSGLVQRRQNAELQEWVLDTEREISSYTVFFVLVPERDIVYEERTIAGVDVRVTAFNSGPSPSQAFGNLESWLPQLNDDLGAFPMPRGISILLLGSGGGMEYYGATATSVWALNHEVFHMYFACSTVNRTFRDTWLDEAITVWYLKSETGQAMPIDANFRSGIVGWRSPIQIGFDDRAYTDGAQIIESVAQELGGRNQMIAFLKYLYENYRFAPFTTWQFLDYLEDYAGVDMRDRFRDWLYHNGNDSQMSEADSAAARYYRDLHRVNLKPPETVLKKYRENKSSN